MYRQTLCRATLSNYLATHNTHNQQRTGAAMEKVLGVGLVEEKHHNSYMLGQLFCSLDYCTVMTTTRDVSEIINFVVQGAGEPNQHVGTFHFAVKHGHSHYDIRGTISSLPLLVSMVGY